MSKTQPRRVARSLDDLVQALQRHVSLLEIYARHAFEDGDENFLGEIAAKLRLLVIEWRSHRSLLLSLLDELGIDISITLGGPPIDRGPGVPRSGDRISLRQFLTLDALGIRTPSAGFVMLNKIQFIRTWAEQHGAAHEDWSVDEAFISSRDLGVYIGGRSAIAAELQTTTDAVLHVAREFLRQVSPQLIALAEASRLLRANPDDKNLRRQMAIALAGVGKVEQALSEFQTLLAQDSASPQLSNELGLVLLKMGRLTEAVSKFRTALEHDERFLDARYNLACAYSRLGQLEECSEELIAVHRSRPLSRDEIERDTDLTAFRADGDRYQAFLRAIDAPARRPE